MSSDAPRRISRADPIEGGFRIKLKKGFTYEGKSEFDWMGTPMWEQMKARIKFEAAEPAEEVRTTGGRLL